MVFFMQTLVAFVLVVKQILSPCYLADVKKEDIYESRRQGTDFFLNVN